MARPQPVPNLVQGVSQQGVQQRRDSQCEEQFDCVNSVSEGCSARPHTDLLRLFPGENWEGAFFTEIIREETGENYLVIVNGSVPEAINLDSGEVCVVTNTAADTYLSTGSPADFKQAIRAQTVEDTTIIASRNAVPILDAAIVSPVRVNEALVFVRSGAYSTDYTIVLSGPASINAVWTTSASDVPADEVLATTGRIAFELHSLINGVNGYSSDVSGSTIRIWRADLADFTVNTGDGNGDEFMLAFKGRVSSYEKLPARSFAGVILEVLGESRTVTDNFWVKFAGTPSAGSWEEVVAPATKTTLKPSTMPHVLVNTGLNTFEWKTQTWSTRIAGDENTAKDPGFVGKRIRDVCWHPSSRLGFLYASGAVWSKSQFPYTFFPDTVQTALATAPVDHKAIAGSASRGATTLDFAVQVDEGVYLWAQRVQYRVATENEAFKQDTVESKPSTAYAYASLCDPLTVGSSLYFMTDVGSFSTMRSIQFTNGKVAGDTDVTAHIPRYINAGVRYLTAHDTLRQIFVQSSGLPEGLYLYNYFVAEGGEYAQSAWNTWRLPGGDILWVGIKDNLLRILSQRPEGVALTVVDLTPQRVDPLDGAAYLTRLDNRLTEGTVTGLTYNAVTGRTSFTLPYVPTGPDVVVVTSVDEPGGFTRGRVFATVSVVGAVVTVEGDLTNYQFYVGQRISAERTESKFYVRNDRGVLPVDRLTVNRFGVEMSDTGYTRIEVSSPNKDPREYVFEGRRLGSSSAQTETPVLSDAQLVGSVSEENHNATIKLINDSFLPSNWQTAFYEYEAVGVAGIK